MNLVSTIQKNSPSSGRLFKKNNKIEKTLDSFLNDLIQFHPREEDYTGRALKVIGLGADYTSILAYNTVKYSSHISEAGLRSLNDKLGKKTKLREKISNFANSSKVKRIGTDLAIVTTSLYLTYKAVTAPFWMPERWEKTADPVRTEVQIEKYSKFKDVKNILIYAISRDELAYDARLLRQLNIRNGTVKDGVKYTLARAGQPIPEVEGGYNIIQLRGHTGDMRQLYSNIGNSRAQNCTLMLGSCDGNIFTPEFGNEKTACISYSGINDAQNNTYILAEVVPALKGSSNWKEFKEKVENSGNIDPNNLILPGEYTNYKTKNPSVARRVIRMIF